MGCRQSKHAVATENTVAKSNSKRSNSIKINNPPVEKATNDEDVIKNTVNGNVKENGIPDAIKIEETENVEEGKESTQGKDEKDGGKEKHGNGESVVEGKVGGKEENLEAAPAVEIVKEEKKKEEREDEELKEEKKDDIICADVEELNSYDSPTHFFSPKRNHEETIESIISEGISGKSEYHSPRAKEHVHEEKAKGNDAVEGQGLEGEAHHETTNEETLKVDEGKEVATIDETKVCASTGEEKTPAADKESANATSPNDVKAN